MDHDLQTTVDFPAQKGITIVATLIGSGFVSVGTQSSAAVRGGEGVKRESACTTTKACDMPVCTCMHSDVQYVHICMHAHASRRINKYCVSVFVRNLLRFLQRKVSGHILIIHFCAQV